jgi:hypothetical protein
MPSESWHDFDFSAGWYLDVVAPAPELIVYEKLDLEIVLGWPTRPHPGRALDANQRLAFVPAKPRAFAPNEKRVSEPNVDLCREGRNFF